MCNYIQREYSCSHLRHIVSHWCHAYATTHKRCPPEVKYFEVKEDICGDCKRKNEPPTPWELMFRQPVKRSFVAVVKIS
ncbi:hypothetical protein VTJ04DRAFT_2186 [Mycothermus thermophilus]|uniref:uncharacterized protein n=1 Tax=Humicola insolens TaxID=85995 RepID=UPI003741EFB2